ncbi:hypothetical protein ATK74_0843 [Propionicimonas paludicola]|uniref:Uncharacterized protein n=1 Tax=Propionicimonas paludicola TaxID=185243 RepID=A0A2A9CRZ2_9ACTN|nr:hypothetical protein [Propionicimonas paludicola]PFG16309.1 hypothetical protein ATK74_0843 [Propionicimonas paludicola]
MSIEETIADLEARKAQLEAAADLLGRNTCIGGIVGGMAAAYARATMLVTLGAASDFVAQACAQEADKLRELGDAIPGLIAMLELAQMLRGVHNVDELRVLKAAREAAAAGVGHVDGH